MMTNYFDLPMRTLRLFALIGILFSAGVCPAAAQVLQPGRIPDIPVLDQDGHPYRFFTDLVKGKVVAINFGYTSCATICPTQGQRFGQLQNLLGSRLGQSVFLVTVTTDPVNDTPAKLKAWGAQFGAKPGWTLVTGLPADIQQLLSAFINPASVTLPGHPIPGAVADGFHLPVVVMVNEPRGLIKEDFSLSAAFWVNQSLTTWYDVPTTKPVASPTKQ